MKNIVSYPAETGPAGLAQTLQGSRIMSNHPFPETPETLILSWCHAYTKGIACMRERHPARVSKGESKCAIVDNNYFGGMVLHEGNSWEEIARTLELM